MEFYHDLFSAQLALEIEEILQLVPTKVTDEMNEGLARPYNEEEVKSSLFMMGPNKALGPDHFIAGFYQSHWDLVARVLHELYRSSSMRE